MIRYDAIPDALVTADLGEGVGVQPVVTWSIDRTLSGDGLPGQARSASGSSVAKGSLTVHPPAGRSPWSVGPVRPGGLATLSARADTGEAWTQIAQMVVRGVSGSAGSQELSLTLEDNLGALHDPVTLPAMLAQGAPIDAADVIARITDEAGVPHDVISSGSPLSAVILEPGRTRWDVVQEIARCTMGAAWMSETGVLTYRPRQMMRAGNPVETIIADESLEDLTWTISGDEVAQRVEVTTTPPTVEVVADGSALVWESTDPIVVPAASTVQVEGDFDGTAAHFAPWLPVWSTAEPIERWSRWLGSTDATGSTPVADDALYVTAGLAGPSRVRVAITNRTAAPVYIQGGGSHPGLTVRANIVARKGSQQTISRGPAPEMHPTTLSVDLGTWVQDPDVATEMLLWLAGNVAEPMPTLEQVRVIPNLARKLGQIVVVRDPRVTKLAAKAVITGIHLSGSDGSLTQTLDLQILAVTFFDLNTWLIAEGLRTFDDLNDRLTSLGLTTFGDLNAYIDNLLGA